MPNMHLEMCRIEAYGGTEHDKKVSSSPGIGSFGYLPLDTRSPMEGGDMVVKEAPKAVVEVPSTKTRRFWLWTVTYDLVDAELHATHRWTNETTRYPACLEGESDHFLAYFSVQLSCHLLHLEFGRLLCPNFNKTWGPNEVAQHQGLLGFGPGDAFRVVSWSRSVLLFPDFCM
jgi:chitin synthase